MVTTTETESPRASAGRPHDLDRVPAQRPPLEPDPPPTPPTPPRDEPGAGSRSRLHAIDGLRFLAAIGVVVYHFTALWSTVWGEDPGERFAATGPVTLYFSLAPELFFVVSGFVVLWTAWGRSPAQVLASRVARVYPAYWVALAMTSALLLLVWPDGKHITPGEAAVNVTLLQEPLGVRHVDGVYWTLWAELRFYVLVTLLVAVGVTRRRVLAFATVWPLAALVVDRLGWDLAGTILISRYAPFFAGGMVLFLIHRDGHARLPWLLVAGNAALAVWTNAPVKAGELDAATTLTADRTGIGIALAGCFALVALVGVTRLRRLDAPWLTTLGGLTYPLYLIHLLWGWWFIHLVHRWLPTPVTLVAAIAFVLALAVGIHAVEERANRPFRHALQRGLERLGAAPAPGAAVDSR